MWMRSQGCWRNEQLSVTATAADDEIVAGHDPSVDPQRQRRGRSKWGNTTDLHAGHFDRLVSGGERALTHTELLTHDLVHVEPTVGQNKDTWQILLDQIYRRQRLR